MTAAKQESDTPPALNLTRRYGQIGKVISLKRRHSLGSSPSSGTRINRKARAEK